jgi:ADP-heptose:LPS heptosyltransferase
MNSVLLIRFGGLGDLLLALPSIRLVRAACPDAHVVLACRKAYGGLLVEAGVVDEIIPEDSPRLLPLFDDERASGAASQGGPGPFDLVIGWTHGGSRHFAKSASFRSRGEGEFHLLTADPRVPSPLSRQFFEKTAAALGAGGNRPIEEYAFLPVIGPPRELRSVRGSYGEGRKRRVIIHPGSGSESKRWPLGNFLTIIGRLGERGVAGLVATGEAEEKMEAELGEAVLPPGWIWVRTPPLTDLATVLREAALYLGNDSGVTHLAAACGVEVVALFRQDLLEVWRPLGRVHLLAAPSLPEIPLDSVWESLLPRLPNFSADRQNS